MNNQDYETLYINYLLIRKELNEREKEYYKVIEKYLSEVEK